MPRFFVKPDQIASQEIVIYGPDVKHISTVLRLLPGDLIEVSDAKNEYRACIINITAHQVIAKVTETIMKSQETPLDVLLLQGLPKGDKMELIIQKCTELGVKKIIPLKCERSVTQLTADKAVKRGERWQRIAEEAAKQSRRSIIPEVELPLALNQALENLPEHTEIIMPWEGEDSVGMREVLDKLKPQGPIAVLIGPEGGFTQQEVEIARQHHARVVSLGPRILRTETAGLVAVTMVLYHLGDLGGKSIV